jgi:maleylacetoacetate isomerase
MELTLYHYWRSTSSWRVRWALAHKGIAWKGVAVDLLSGAPESPEHLARNPLGYVPVLEIAGMPGKTEAVRLFESMAILEWLEESFPGTAPLFPGNAWDRARIRQLCEIINSDTQPLQNLNPQFLHAPGATPADAEARKHWAQHWIRNGLHAYEVIARETAGTYSVGDTLSAADLVLIPQVYNAARYEVSLEDWPVVKRITENARATASHAESEPERFKPV